MFNALIDILRRTIEFLQDYNGAVTAVATVAIGIFTWFLVRVTSRQAKLTKAAVEAATAQAEIAKKLSLSLNARISSSSMSAGSKQRSLMMTQS